MIAADDEGLETPRYEMLPAGRGYALARHGARSAAFSPAC
jgi:hypothetical protein